MKALICEMCNSNDLIKQGGVFVCQSCGTKYSVEEAKNMMVKGQVDVSGSTVKIDKSDELTNLYILARRAKDENNSAKAARYYEMALIKNPTDWEAAFYADYFRALDCTDEQIQSAGVSVENCVDSVLNLIKDNVKSKKDQINAVLEVSQRCTTISETLYNRALENYNEIDEQSRFKYTQEMLDNCWAAQNIMYVLGDSIDSVFGDYEELRSAAVSAWKDGISKHCELMPFMELKKENKKIIMDYATKVKQYDASYHVPALTSFGSGCYVATCVYGSYDCPQVWTLRRYRDCILAKTWYGRAFVHAYYAVSPTLVKWFGHTEWFKRMWRGKLDRMVTKLQSEGIDSSPYEDRCW